LVNKKGGHHVDCDILLRYNSGMFQPSLK